LRIVNAQLGGSGFELPHEIQVRQSSAAEIGNSALREVFRINLAVILADEWLGLDCSPRLPVSKLRHDFFNDFRVFVLRLW